MTVDDSFDCFDCHQKTCKDCFDRNSGLCHECRTKRADDIESEYLTLLRRVYESGCVNLAGRRELIEKQKQLNLAVSRAMELERIVKEEFVGNDDSSPLSTFEKFTLSKSIVELYGNGDPVKALVLLNPVFKVHSLDESVVTHYLAALSMTDKDEARSVIARIQVDMLGAYLSEIDMAISENDVNSAEERLISAEKIWSGSILLKCRRVRFLQLMYEITADDSYLAEASNVIIELGEPSNPLEASWILYVQNLVSKALGDELPELTEAYCKNNNLYFAVATGKLFV